MPQNQVETMPVNADASNAEAAVADAAVELNGHGALTASDGSAPDTILQTRGLTKIYRPMFARQGKTALQDLTIDVRRGEIFGLVGPNGSGKTTTLKLLLGLIKPSAGSVEIFGRGPRDVAVKKRIGFLPDGPYFYDHLNSFEVLDFYGKLFGYSKQERSRRTEELLDMVALNPADRARTIRTYSKGMMQRVGLAQALINDPELLFLDEPTTGLDPIGARAMKDAILSVRARGKTVLLCSHLLADVQAICDRVAILSEGHLVKFGTVPELVGPSQEFEVFALGLSAAALEQAQSRGFAFTAPSADGANGSAANGAAANGSSGDAAHRASIRFRAASSEQLDSVLNFIRDAGGKTVDVKGHSETLEDVFVRSVRSDGR